MAIQVPIYRQQTAFGSAPSVSPTNERMRATGVGDAISDAGDAMTRVAATLNRMKEQDAQANAIFAVSDTNLAMEEAFQTAKTQAQPGAPDFTPQLLTRFDEEIEKRASTLADEPTRKAYRERMAASRDNFGARSLQWQVQERQRNVTSQFSKSVDNDANQLFSADSASRAAVYQSQDDIFNQSLDVIELEPSAKEALREEARNKRSFAAVQGDLRDRPDKVQDWLVKGGGSNYFSMLRAAESGGRNIGSSTSSAFGPYQFTAATWTNVLKRHPELKLTEADRFKPEAQEIAIRAFTADNAHVLKSAGLPQTDVNLYMMHFLGEAGGPRMIRALAMNPQDDARLHVTTDQAAANASIFNGRSVEQLFKLFGGKFGDKETWSSVSDAPTYYRDIPFAKRDALYGQAETEMNKRRVQGEAAFKQRVENSLAQYATTGASTSAPTEQEFVAAMGAQRGTLAYGEFAARGQGAAASYKMQSMPPQQIPAFVESFRPSPDDPFLAEKQAAFSAVSEVANRLAEERRNDPAQQVIRRHPEAEVAFREGVASADKAKIDEWISLTRVEGSSRLLPNSVRDEINRSLTRVPQDQAQATALWQEIQKQKMLWGAEWPQVLRELGETASDLRVIGSGIGEEAATILLANRKNSMQELTKVLPAGSAPSIDSSLQEELEDYARSLRLPGEDGAAFFAAAQKLAAVKMRDGIDASTAAEWSYQQLIGSKYVFDNDARIPKQHEAIVDKLEDAKIQALSTVDLSGLQEGVTPEDARLWLETASRWVTLPDDSGVILMDGPRALRDAQNRVVFRNWSDISKIERNPDAAHMRAIDAQGRY